MESQVGGIHNPLEQAGYLEFGGAHIYSVLHGVRDPVARILLVGPFASERFFSYIPWVRWARFLAARRIEALRFDYRGVGESTGSFEDMSFSAWNDDVEFLAGWLKKRSPDVPLILQGLELGALLASNTFVRGAGDALLLWAAPANANEVLRRPLSREAFKSLSDRKPLSDYIRALEAGRSLDVDGYPYSVQLWRESLQLESPLTTGAELNEAASGCRRPSRSVKLSGSLASQLRGSPMGYAVPPNLDLNNFFVGNYAWIVNALPALQGGNRDWRN